MQTLCCQPRSDQDSMKIAIARSPAGPASAHLMLRPASPARMLAGRAIEASINTARRMSRAQVLISHIDAERIHWIFTGCRANLRVRSAP